jgi:excinuclease UvrABC nuclease subunit
MTIKLNSFVPPYLPNGRCSHKRSDLFGKSGVYLIRRVSDQKWLYIGKGTCVYRQLYSHFQNYIKRDVFHNGIAYKNVFIEKDDIECTVVPTDKYHDLETRLIKKYKPILNRRVPKKVPRVRVVQSIDFVANHSAQQSWQYYIDKYGQEPF